MHRAVLYLLGVFLVAMLFVVILQMPYEHFTYHDTTGFTANNSITSTEGVGTVVPVRSGPVYLRFSDKPYLVFAHVQKTSGMAMNRVMLDISTARSWKFRWFYKPRITENLLQYNYIYGHGVNAVLGQLEGKNFTFSVVRKPLNRIISNYKHWLREYGAILKAESSSQINNLTFQSFFIPSNYHLICNHQWEMIFGSRLINTAQTLNFDNVEQFLHEATSTYLLLLLYEERKLSFALLGQALRETNDDLNALPFDPCEKAALTLNTGQVEEMLLPNQSHISLEHIRQVEDCNQLDIALYNFAKRHFERLTRNLKYSCKST